MPDFERTIEFKPAFDKRDPNPAKNYGVHCVEMRWLLKRPKGIIQFVLYTGWHLPHVQEELQAKCHERKSCPLSSLPADIGYHSPVPVYEGQGFVTESCPYLGGVPCYYDGSSLNAEPIFEKLVTLGHEAVWKEMEKWYYNTFGEEADPHA